MSTLTPDQTSFFAILIVAFTLLVTEWFRTDLVAVLIIVAVYATGLLDAKEALDGFSSEPAIVVAAIFVLSEALHQTGVSDALGRWIGRLAGKTYSRIIAVMMPAVALLSAFTHHLTMTAIMLPVTIDMARERQIPASKLLMPLAFAASMGTTITIIGAPAFLIASATLQQVGRPGLGIFEIAPIGLALTVVGTLFIMVFGRLLIPTRRGQEEALGRFRLDGYYTELAVLEGSPLMGLTLDEIERDPKHNMTVVGWLREGKKLPRPFGDHRVQIGDVLIVRTTPEQMLAFREEEGHELHPLRRYAKAHPDLFGDVEDVSERLTQAVVAPGSELVGKSLREVDFHRRYGAIVVGLWRRSAWFREEMAGIKLRAGDVLVLMGADESLAKIQNDPAFLLLVPFQGETQLRQKAPLAALIMMGTVLATVFGIMSIEMAALAGATAMVLFRCVTGRQAYRAIDTRIYVFIAGAIPLGTAMKKSGSAELMAEWLTRLVGGWDELFILAAFFTTVAVLTQFMSDAATTALFAPVAAALAQSLGHSPEPYVVTVAMASVAGFLTPIGHHGNLLVYAPGGYQFTDFVRVGTPLTLIGGVVVVMLSPLLWP